MACESVDDIGLEECKEFCILEMLQYDIDLMQSISAESIEKHFIPENDEARQVEKKQRTS